MIREPGIHPDVPESTYHADPALSQSSAKVLLASPARYHWQLDHPRADTNAFDIGHAAHAKVLGIGLEIVTIPDELLSSNGAVGTNAAKAWVAEARASGAIPLLRKEADAIDLMAEAVLAHPRARNALEREGIAEQSAWWSMSATDGTEIPCRGRFDWLTTDDSGLPAIVDLKTTGKDAGPVPFAKSVVDFGYDLQQAWYTTGFETLTGQPAAFVFIVVEKEPPHLTAVHVLDQQFTDRGHRLMRDALDLYARCTATGVWPGHGDDINILTPPRWAS